MKRNFKLLLLIILSMSVVFAGCKKEDTPAEENTAQTEQQSTEANVEEEDITVYNDGNPVETTLPVGAAKIYAASEKNPIKLQSGDVTFELQFYQMMQITLNEEEIGNPAFPEGKSVLNTLIALFTVENTSASDSYTWDVGKVYLYMPDGTEIPSDAISADEFAANMSPGSVQSGIIPFYFDEDPANIKDLKIKITAPQNTTANTAGEDLIFEAKLTE